MSIKFSGKPNMDGWVSCYCPVHNDHNPSATYNIHSGYLKCFSCGASLKYAQLKSMFGPFGAPPRNGYKVVVNRRGERIDWRDYYNKAHREPHDYLTSRGLTDETIEKYQIRHNEEGVILPIFQRSIVSGHMLLGIIVRRFKAYGGRYRYYFDSSKPLFYPNVINSDPDDKGIFITEGAFGVHNINRLGYQAYSIMGTNIKDSHLNILNMVAGSLDIFIAFDADFPGIRAALKLASAHTNIKILLPGLEADEVGLKALEFMAEGAQPLGHALQYYRYHAQDY